jgi:predicted phage terminase large subunit-like protein
MPKQIKCKSTAMQEWVFGDKHQYVVLAKGRRAGGTQGAIIHLFESMLNSPIKCLWVDTVQGNLGRYYERYFLPLLRQLPKDYWDWYESKKLLKIGESYLDMRSAERPENIEGFGYHKIICNEAGIIFAQNSTLWFNSILPMTLDHKSQVFFIGTPKGKIDKTGNEHLFYTFYKKGVPGSLDKNWVSYNFTTYDNPFLKKEDIQALEDEIPALIREQELGGKFVDVNLDSIFKEEWFLYTTENELPKPQEIIRTIISMDTAFKVGAENDYSAATVWVQTLTKFICIDMWVERVTFPELIKRTEKLVKRYNPNCVVVEDKASGQSLIQSFQQSTLPVIAFKTSTDKISRCSAVTPLLQNKKIYLLEGHWNKNLVNNCVLFPNGEFDDICDAFCIGLLYMTVGATWSKSRMPISNKIIRKSAGLNGYDAQPDSVVVPIATNVPDYSPPEYPNIQIVKNKETILQGY